MCTEVRVIRGDKGRYEFRERLPSSATLAIMNLDFDASFTERTPRIIDAAKLHRSSARKKAKAFLVEGPNCVEAAIATGAAQIVYVTYGAAERYPEILASAEYLNVSVHPITKKAAEHLCDTVTSTGLFAVCSPVLWPAAKILQAHPRLVTVPVLTSDPGNAGTLIRVSDALGADAVVFAGESVDPQGGKAARASAGSLFHIPVARKTNIAEVLTELKSAGLQLLATSADGEVSIEDAGELLHHPTAWLFGNEAHGLGSDITQQADYRIRIPIRGSAESLNLATAAAICLYESSRIQSA